MEKLTPIRDYILVKTSDAEPTSRRGIIIPDQGRTKPERGTVLAVGPGRVEDGERVPMTVKEGDEVIWSKYGGTDVVVDEKEFKILTEKVILGIVRRS